MKPVMLGMCNPEGGEPMDPTGTTGRKFAIMIGSDTFAVFERHNMLRQRTWRGDAARRAASSLRKKLAGRTVVVLGNEVWHALGLSKAEWFSSVKTDDGTTWWRIPHPSGINSMYNDKRNILKARKIMGMIADDAIGSGET